MAMAKVTEFLTIDPTTIVLTLCNTLILFLILKHFLFDKINKIIEARRNDIEESYKRADDAERRADQLAAEYTERLGKAREESAELVRNAARKAQARSDEIIAEAKLEAKGIIDSAGLEIEREKKIAVNQIKDEIAQIAVSAASAVVEKEISAEDNERLIESFIDSVGEV
ncbi:F0F1 ATP synthase subunit B [Ruminococcus sp. Marseille-P6503]|uniref:F0F1 ATP synthase subunit B n=1 Tax=Ruminococcus sp. Marseille-P6503 TaxID=2364796 RepID=UPI000F549CAF|nr:F0F1 ATP synthase subunit B [Ruminococcus sp. Marseille-P6503]